MDNFNIHDKYNRKFIVSEAIYNGFINVFNDKNLLHTDTYFAQSYKFKNCVMHGNILNGFLSYFVGECLPVKNVIIHSQTIEYKNAVYLNDELDMEAEVVEVYESVKAIEFKFSFKSSMNKTVAKGKIQIGVL